MRNLLIHASAAALALASAPAFAAPPVQQPTARVAEAPQPEAQPITPMAVSPTKLTYSFTIPAGGNSKVITPPASTPVFVTAANLTESYRGVASMALLRIADQFLEWSGVSSTYGAAIEDGFSGTPGTHMLWIDYSHLVDLQVSGRNTFYVHNGNTIPMSVKVTLSY